MTDPMNFRDGAEDTYAVAPAGSTLVDQQAPAGGGYQPESKTEVKAAPVAPAAPQAAAAVADSPSNWTRVAAPKPVASWGWSGRVARWSGGAIKPKAGAAEQAFLDAESLIRQTTWTRAVNVMVTNEKGGVGKSPTALLLGGALARVRGGSVAVVEACEARGTLSDRAQGNPARGLSELLRGMDEGTVVSAGTVAGFTSPQTSHAAVIGSVWERDALSGRDVRNVRRTLDTYYQITITDTGNNHHADPYEAAVATADALVIPVQPNTDSVAGMMRTLDKIAATGPHGLWLVEHATALITHRGEPEPQEVVTGMRAAIDAHGLGVAEVPFDPEIRRGGEISWDRLSVASQRAWTLAAAQVVSTLLDAPEIGPLTSEDNR